MNQKLRSEFKEGTVPWAMRRAHWRALGYSDADLAKPKIAIVNSSSDLAVCFTHLDEVSSKLKQAIFAAGGIPMEVRTAAPSDFITAASNAGGYILAGRDLIPNDIEVAVKGAMLDGMVCLASCDKTAPGQLMAAARMNIPTLFIACGYQPSGKYKGEHFDIEDLFINVGKYSAGQLSLEELTEMSDVAVQGPGVCPGIGTANSMHCVTEALGMALSGSTPVLANSPKMWQTVRRAGARIVEMVREDLKPRDILTEAAFENAAITILATSGSINCIKHLQAVAAEAQCKSNVYKLFEDLAGQVPLLTAIRPNGDHLIEDFEEAGGTLALLKQLQSKLRTDAKTVDGVSLKDLLDKARVNDENVIRAPENAWSTRPAIALLKGNLAQEYGIVKLAVEDDRPTTFEGPAMVFETREEAIAAIKAGNVPEGCVLVLRGFGIKGNPGMGLCSNVVFALDGAGLTEKVAMITDGTVSGLCNKILLVCELSPEMADGGAIALIEDGDPIRIDVAAHRVDLLVSEDEQASRRERLPAFTNDDNGWLSIYQRLVKPLPEGAVLTK